MIKIIVCTDQLGGIGYQGKLPWPKEQGDLKFFREVTMGHPLIMGWRTWVSLREEPLVGRHNIVIDRNDDINKVMDDYPNAYIIGGARTYNAAMDRVERIILTKLKSSWECDTHFHVGNEWRETGRITRETMFYKRR